MRRIASGGARARIRMEDFQLALEERRNNQKSYDALDAVLFEATTQLAEPTARAVVRITLVNGTDVEGDVLWIDPVFVKIRLLVDNSTCIVPKNQIVQLSALEGTAAVAAFDVQVDRIADSGPNFA